MKHLINLILIYLHISAINTKLALNLDLQTLKEENFKLLQQRPNMDEFKSLDEGKKLLASEFSKFFF